MPAGIVLTDAKNGWERHCSAQDWDAVAKAWTRKIGNLAVSQGAFESGHRSYGDEGVAETRKFGFGIKGACESERF